MLISFAILFILIYFFNFHPNVNSFIGFRQDYFSFRPYFCLIADIYAIICFTITFSLFIMLQNEIYYKQSTIIRL